MILAKSPYARIPRSRWKDVTGELIEDHPLEPKEIVEVVEAAWDSIFVSDLGTGKFRIGVDIFPKPQIMGFLLHELIPLEFAAKHTGEWRGDKSDDEKDLVYVPDEKYSIEIKTSSDRAHIFGNRSYAQKTASFKKSKSGYYLAVNFSKFTVGITKPKLTIIRFGWLDHSDWVGQKSASGQQAHLKPFVEEYKLRELYRV